MKKALLLLLTFTHLITLKAQEYCIENRFTQSDYFDSTDIVLDYNIPYGFADDWYMDYPQPILNTFDIAYPDLAIDPLVKRPVIMLAHGGGFWGGEKEALNSFIQTFARAGYVAISMNYRKGWDGSPDDCSGDPYSLNEAIYCAMQDVHACMRYVVAHADDYGIDTGAIFVGGESAGVYAIMNSVLMSQDDWAYTHPSHVAEFGPMFTSTNNLTTTFTVKGFINMWGGMADISYIDPNEMAPIISFYGIYDSIIPPISGPIKYCEGYQTVYGSASIAQFLTDHGVCNVLHKNLTAGHEAYMPDYTIPHIACFVKSVLCDECQTSIVNDEVAECSDQVIIESITDANLEEIAVSPNPANSYANINLSAIGTANLVLQFMDITGKLFHAPYVINGNFIYVNTSAFPPGMYVILAENNGDAVTGRLTIAK